jgi:MFS family permease
LDYIRDHPAIRWSLIYLGIAASLVGMLGVLGPSFAQKTLGLSSEDFVVVVLPLGVGIVMGILLLNAYGRLVPRRRVIEGGLIALGVLLAAMALSGRISLFLDQSVNGSGRPDLSLLTSLLSIVVAVAFFAGIAYAAVAIPAQTQLQEELPADVRGRVFGILNMLVSVASFAPILIVGPIADLLGTTNVLIIVAVLIVASGVSSIYLRGPLGAVERVSRASVGQHGDPFVEALRAEIAGPDTRLGGGAGSLFHGYGSGDPNRAADSTAEPGTADAAAAAPGTADPAGVASSANRDALD